jgi:hypothetical protein
MVETVQMVLMLDPAKKVEMAETVYQVLMVFTE